MFGILLLKFIYSPDTPSIELHSTINKLGPIEMTAVNMKYENWYVWILLNTTLIKFTKPCRLHYIKQLSATDGRDFDAKILPCYIRRINSPRVSDIHCQVFCFKMWQKTTSIIYKQGDGFLSTIRRSMGWLINIWR